MRYNYEKMDNMMKSQPESTKKHTFNVFMQRNCNFCIESTINHTLMELGAIIKERRALLGISQQDLSDFSGVGISTIKDLERGVGNPSIKTLNKILEVVGLEMLLRIKQTVV